MTLPPLIGKLEIRETPDGFELWHLPPKRVDWELIGSHADRTVLEEWKALGETETVGHRSQGQDGATQPSRAVAFDFTQDGDTDHGTPIWPHEPLSPLQALMEARPHAVPAETADERQAREAASAERVAAVIAALTVKQRMVVDLLAAGWTQADVARELGLDKTTIRDYVRRVRAALGSADDLTAQLGEVSPATHPERYMVEVGPAEPWCDLCTPPEQKLTHSRECAGKTFTVRLVRIPLGAQL